MTMGLARVDHIGIAVKDIEKSISFFKKVFGAKLLHKNIVEEQKLLSALVSLRSINVELMQSIENNSVINKFIEKHGEGVHHISVQVENLDRFLEGLSSVNIKITNKFANSNYKIAFIHPKCAFGVLIEVIERITASDQKK
jgi:methylmalonyl-CoA epimerase